MKSTDEIYEVGEDVVRLTRVEIHRYDWGTDGKGNPGHPMEKVRRAEERARDKIESAQRQAQLKVEREKLAREIEAHRQETLEGLESIRDRLGGQLTNYETEMLQRAIEQWREVS